jgi:predicted transcriptional regulator
MQPQERARILRAAQLCREKGVQQSQVAAAAGASQSQVSRVLSGRGRRFSRISEEICAAVERIVGSGSSRGVQGNSELMDAIRDTWDGSASHAQALATVIRSLAALRARTESESASAVRPAAKASRS